MIIFRHHVDTSQPLADEYDPPSVEAAWYEWWVAKVIAEYFPRIDSLIFQRPAWGTIV